MSILLSCPLKNFDLENFRTSENINMDKKVLKMFIFQMDRIIQCYFFLQNANSAFECTHLGRLVLISRSRRILRADNGLQRLQNLFPCFLWAD